MDPHDHKPLAEHLSPKNPSACSAKPPSSTSATASANLSRTDLSQFFARMEHLYGHRWTGQYGKPLNEQGDLTISARQWQADIGEFTPAQIRGALKATETEYQDWPPTVPQFKAMCRGVPSGAPDPRMTALLKANDALQDLLTDAKLGLLPTRVQAYDDRTRQALEAMGGADAVMAADHAKRQELGSRFVRTYLAGQPVAPRP